MNIANALGQALQLEALIMNREEEKVQRVAAIRRDETEVLIGTVSRLVKQMSVGNENNARSSDGQRVTATGEERDAMGPDIGNKVQENEQELASQGQIRAKEKTIPEGKAFMTNFDYVGKRIIEQTTAVVVLLVEILHKLSEISHGIKRLNKPT